MIAEFEFRDPAWYYGVRLVFPRFDNMVLSYTEPRKGSTFPHWIGKRRTWFWSLIYSELNVQREKLGFLT